MDIKSSVQKNDILTPLIDREKCCGDKLCVKACIRRCLSMDKENKARYRPIVGECFQCGHCLAICPKQAINFEGINIDSLVHGKAKIETEDLSHLIRMRRSIRDFKDECIPLEELRKALETAHFAPTGKNVQDVRWLIVSDKEKIQEISRLTGQVLADANPDNPLAGGLLKAFNKGRNLVCYNAPQIIFAYSPKEIFQGSSQGISHALQNSTIAVSYLELLLNSMNIGTCWAGYIINAANIDLQINNLLNISEEFSINSGLLIGYAKLKYQRSVMRKGLDLQVI